MTHQQPERSQLDRFPFNTSVIDLHRASVTYLDEGDGPVLLFVHTGLWSFVFRDAILQLRNEYRCITLDFPGYGMSAGSEALPLSEMSALLAEFVSELELEGVTLVVHDLGGLVGVGAAALAPERYAGLVLANTFTWTPDTLALRLMLRVMSSRVVTALDVATNVVPRLTASSFGVGRHLDAEDRAVFLGPFADRSVRRRFHTAMRSALEEVEFTDATDRATRTSLSGLPTLTIFGERNDPFGFQRRHHAVFDDHESVVVRKGNHFPMMDDPELFADSIRGWHSRKVQSVGAGR